MSDNAQETQQQTAADNPVYQQWLQQAQQQAQQQGQPEPRFKVTGVAPEDALDVTHAYNPTAGAHDSHLAQVNAQPLGGALATAERAS